MNKTQASSPRSMPKKRDWESIAAEVFPARRMAVMESRAKARGRDLPKVDPNADVLERRRQEVQRFMVCGM